MLHLINHMMLDDISAARGKTTSHFNCGAMDDDGGDDAGLNDAHDE